MQITVEEEPKAPPCHQGMSVANCPSSSLPGNHFRSPGFTHVSGLPTCFRPGFRPHLLGLRPYKQTGFSIWGPSLSGCSGVYSLGLAGDVVGTMPSTYDDVLGQFRASGSNSRQVSWACEERRLPRKVITLPCCTLHMRSLRPCPRNSSNLKQVLSYPHLTKVPRDPSGLQDPAGGASQLEACFFFQSKSHSLLLVCVE